MRRTFFLSALMLTAALLALFIGCSRRQAVTDDTIVATWGDTAMTVKQFKDWMLIRHRDESTAEKQPLKERLNIITEYVVRDAKLLEGRRLGFAEREDIQKEYRSAVERRAGDLLYNERVRDRCFAEKQILDWYEHDQEEVRCRHILIAMDTTVRGRDTLTYWNRINEASQAAKSGNDFTRLVDTYSEDKSLQPAAKGDLGFFRWGRMVDEFQETAWKLKPGEISSPVRTRYGYHIIQMIERRPTNWDYRTSHILVKVNRRDAPAETTIAFERAKSILAEAKKSGADFVQLARKYSEDERTWVNGDVGWVAKGTMPTEYWEAGHKMKVGEFTGPVRTYKGYHIIRLDEKRDKKRSLDDSEVREEVLSNLSRVYRDTLKIVADAYLDSVRRVFGQEYDRPVVQLILRKLSDKSTPTNVNLFSSFTPQEREMLVVRDRLGGVKLQQLVDMYGDHRFPPNFRNDESWVREMTDPIATPRYLNELAKSEGYYDRTEVIQDGKRALDNAILPEIEREMVFNKAAPTEAELKQYYEANRAKYGQAASASIYEVMVDDKQLANDLLGRIKKGEEISSLARRYTMRENAKGKGGRLGPFGKDDYGPVSRKALEMKVGEIAGPIQNDKFFSVVKLIELTPEKIQSFDEVRRQIEPDVRFNQQAKIKEDWEAEIRRAYNITFHEDVLRAVWPEIEQLPETTAKERRDWKEQRRQAGLRKQSEDQIKLKLRPGSEQEFTTKEGKKVQVKIGEPRYLDKEGKEIDPKKSTVKLTPKGQLEVKPGTKNDSKDAPVIKLQPKGE